MFRVLLVDDNPINLHLLREALNRVPRPCHIDWVADGSAALDYLSKRRSHPNGSQPDLILLDLHMPGVDGLEALVEIKADPELNWIPVIMLSTSVAPVQVRKIYQAHANGLVQKPISLDQSVRVLQSILMFWMDFAILPPSRDGDNGPPGAALTVEARSPAMEDDESAIRNELQRSALRSSRVGCEEHSRLLDDFAAAVTELLLLHEQQFVAITQDDPECHRFDLLIHMANEKKQNCKYAYLRHVESHGCLKQDATNDSGARSD